MFAYDTNILKSCSASLTDDIVSLPSAIEAIGRFIRHVLLLRPQKSDLDSTSIFLDVELSTVCALK